MYEISDTITYHFHHPDFSDPPSFDKNICHIIPDMYEEKVRTTAHVTSMEIIKIWSDQFTCKFRTREASRLHAMFYFTGWTVMGEFQRSRSKVWWSNYAEADTEDDRIVGWGGAGPVLSPSRGSSSSPSSSHKSQDSGFSDSETSAAPAGSGECFKPSPLSSQDRDPTVSRAQDRQEVTGFKQNCECPQAESTFSEDSSCVGPKSPVIKLKGQLLSHCVCVDQTSRKDIPESTTVEVDGKGIGTSELTHRNVDCPTQLPVRKIRHDFLQDCMCLKQAPECRCDAQLPDKSTSSPGPENKPHQELCKPSNEAHEAAETDSESGNCLERRKDQKGISVPEERANSTVGPDEHSSQTRTQSSLSRSAPVPTIRTTPRNHKECPRKSVRGSPIASPKSPRNKRPSNSQCDTSEVSPRQPSGEGSNHFCSPSKETKENANLPVQPVSSQVSSGDQGTPSVTVRSPKRLSNRSPAGEHTAKSLRATSDREDSSSLKPLCSELPDHLGSPTHTSTPKTSSATSPNKLYVTPGCPLPSPGSGKKHGRPVNLLNNFKR